LSRIGEAHHVREHDGGEPSGCDHDPASVLVRLSSRGRKGDASALEAGTFSSLVFDEPITRSSPRNGFSKSPVGRDYVHAGLHTVDFDRLRFRAHQRSIR
jgi:hypothetical protein